MVDAQYRLNPEPPSGIIPEGCTFSPDEVGAMLANRVVQPHYAAWLVRQAIEAANAREVAALQERIDNLEASGVHTCGVHCKRPVCVMRRRAEAAEADARRYRWLRDDGDGPGNAIAAAVAEGNNEHGGEYVSWLYGDELDAAIDAAIASGGEDRK